MHDTVLNMVLDTVSAYVDKAASKEAPVQNWDIKELNDTLRPIVPLNPIVLTEDEKKKADPEVLKERLRNEAEELYKAKEAEFEDPEQMREVERVILLKVVDRKWMDNIDDMAQLRQGIGLQGYGSRDPVVEYKMAGYEMFEDMTEAIRDDTSRLIMHVKIQEKVEREQVAKVTGTNKDETASSGPKTRIAPKVYPNDPCPCGSGKKYKNCCGAK
jgi:preprotein translocase subunit SecA